MRGFAVLPSAARSPPGGHAQQASGQNLESAKRLEAAARDLGGLGDNLKSLVGSDGSLAGSSESKIA